MIEGATKPDPADSVESFLRENLAHGDAMLGAISPVLRHLLVNDDHAVFGDEIVARVRGMLDHVARQILDELAAAEGGEDRRPHDEKRVETLATAIAGAPAFLAHAHALALEWQLTERLQGRLALDPVLSPLLQALIASPDTVTSDLAMRLLASQARFCQAQRRMQLPLTELPGDLLHGALLAMRALADSGMETNEFAAAAETAIRGRYDESISRLGLIARLVTGMGSGVVAALSISHGGVAIFLSALSLVAGNDRDVAVLCTNESQLIRLALTLRAAGLKPQAVAEQLIALHPDVALPEGLDRLSAERAAAILAASGGFCGA